MAKFKAGDNPADFKVGEVVEFLKGDEATPDEYDRVMAAERERDNGGRVGILNLSGVEDTAPAPTDEALTKPDGSEAAGPNEAATGQESPADQASTSSDPQASGDEALTAEQYPDEAPAQLGPEMPQSEAEKDAHAQSLAAHAAATQTPDQARALAAQLAQQWKTPRAAASDDEQ